MEAVAKKSFLEDIDRKYWFNYGCYKEERIIFPMQWEISESQIGWIELTSLKGK